MILFRTAYPVGLSALLAAGLLLSAAIPATTVASEKTPRRVIVANPKFDPSAETVDLFDGLEDGRFQTKVVAQDSTGGVVLITNTTDETLTVDVPESVVFVQVLKQLGAGMGGMGGGGQGFFSIPPEKTIKVPFRSACLNHGKHEPTPQVEYRLVRTTEYTDDPVLAELIRMVGTGRLDQQSAQAAIWTRTDNLTFDQLASKQVRGIQGVRYYFRPEQIALGRQLVTTAQAQVRERGEDPEPKQSTSDRVR